MKMQRLLSYVRRAVQDYDMIQDGFKRFAEILS